MTDAEMGCYLFGVIIGCLLTITAYKNKGK